MDEPRHTLPPQTTLGSVTLKVRDAQAALAVWRDIAGLSVLASEAGHVRLGTGGRVLVELRAGAGPAADGPAIGLFHVALHVTSRAALSGILARIRAGGRRHTGQDHTLSESLYIDDDDGNGIEFAFDTPGRGRVEVIDGAARAIRTDGRILTVIEPLDLEALAAEAPEGHPARLALPHDSFVGHIHFRSNNRDGAFGFYTDVLGFRPNANAQGFKFCDVGTERRGHMIAFNSWAGESLPAAKPDAPGVERFVVRLPDPADIQAVALRLRAAGHTAIETPDGLLTADPDGNAVMLTHDPEMGA